MQEVEFFVGFEFLEDGVGAGMRAREDDAEFGSSEGDESIVWRKFGGVVVKKDGNGFGKGGALGSSNGDSGIASVGEGAGCVGG